MQPRRNHHILPPRTTAKLCFGYHQCRRESGSANTITDTTHALLASDAIVIVLSYLFFARSSSATLNFETLFSSHFLSICRRIKPFRESTSLQPIPGSVVCLLHFIFSFERASGHCLLDSVIYLSADTSTTSLYSSDQFMNPGPAPRPPGDYRPRLNLTPAVANIPGNMVALPLSTRGSTSSLSRGEREGGGALAVVKEGPARIKEEGFMRGVFWSEKWLILRETQLDFHKSQSSPKISFSIALKDITAVNRCDTAPMAFEILRAANPANFTTPAPNGSQLTKTIICRVEKDSEVYMWIDEIYARCPGSGGVSNPTNFAHQVHVGWDPKSGTFVGLPPEWERLLNSSAITKEDYKENPTAVIEALNFYTENLVTRNNGSPNHQIAHGSGRARREMGVAGAQSPQRLRQPNGLVRDDSYEVMSKPYTNEQITPINDSPMSAYGPDAGLEGERRRRMEDEARREQFKREQREKYQAREKREREEQAAYSSALPQMRSGNTRQATTPPRGEDGRDPVSNISGSPSRAAGKASPSRDLRRAPSGSLRQMVAQRPAPAPPSASNGTLTSASKPSSHQKESSSSQRYQEQTTPKPYTQQNDGDSLRFPVKPSYPIGSPAAVQAPKPLNVTVKPPTGPAAVAEAAKQAEEEPRQQTRRELRMSAMTESEVMVRLREVVSPEPPLQSYNKQKKIGQGASGSVYVAKIRENAISPFARNIIRDQGPKAQVAIKQMDLKNQPRKELIVNEIVVMKDSKHPNIVNFIEAFLPEEQTELWVVMEFMEGGPLTDVIDNNPNISEGQIATICYEVS